jgi:hypothetical protein
MFPFNLIKKIVAAYLTARSAPPAVSWTLRNGMPHTVTGTPSDMALFYQARAMYERGAGMMEIANLYMQDRTLYQGRTQAEVVKTPVYRAILDMASRRGIDQGYLSDRPGRRPPLVGFLVPVGMGAGVGAGAGPGPTGSVN